MGVVVEEYVVERTAGDSLNIDRQEGIDQSSEHEDLKMNAVCKTHAYMPSRPDWYMPWSLPKT